MKEKMSLEEFVTELRDALLGHLPEGWDVMIAKDKSTITLYNETLYARKVPMSSFNAERAYQVFLERDDDISVVKNAFIAITLEAINNSLENEEPVASFAKQIEDFEFASKFLKLIIVPENSIYANNAVILEKIPGIPDLCLVAKIVNADLNIIATPKPVTYEMWGVSPEEVFAIAKENSKKYLEVMNLSNFTGYEDITPMLVVTDRNSNNTPFFGGAAIFFKENARIVSKTLGGDFYIIPSSVHETICLSAKLPEDHTSLEIKETILEVNRSLPENERLSDHLYMYHRDTCTYSVVE